MLTAAPSPSAIRSAAAGARIVLHLLQVLERNQAQRGMAALCIGGGQGGAMLIERGRGGAHGHN